MVEPPGGMHEERIAARADELKRCARDAQYALFDSEGVVEAFGSVRRGALLRARAQT